MLWHLDNWKKEPIFNVRVFNSLSSYHYPLLGLWYVWWAVGFYRFCGSTLSYPFTLVGIALAFFYKIGWNGERFLSLLWFYGGRNVVLIVFILKLWDDVFGCEEYPWKKQGAVSHFRVMGDQTLLPEGSYHLKFTWKPLPCKYKSKKLF